MSFMSREQNRMTFLWAYRSLVVLAFACEDVGRMFDHSFLACADFFVLFLEVGIGSRTLISLFRPGSSTVAQRAETIVAECVLNQVACELVSG